MYGNASALVPGHLSMRAGEIGFEEQGDRDKWKLAPVKVTIMPVEEHAKPCS